MNKYKYSKDQNIQMLLSVLKENHIRKIVVSPGTANVLIVGSIQQDDYFEMYSAVDERGAAYIACGLAAESGEPVALSCTGATASRNYFPGLTEAYYRKLPILAITSAQRNSTQGNLSPQNVDRSVQPKDTVRFSVQLPVINDEDDLWSSNLKINQAVLELFRHGGGPVHIDIPTDWRGTLTEGELSTTRCIKRYFQIDRLPKIKTEGRIAIRVGYHSKWSKELEEVVEKFCEKYNAVVLTEHSSGYRGKYHINATLLAAQELHESELFDIDLLIHIGETVGDMYVHRQLMKVKEVWRVSEDGELRDPFHKLTSVFEMDEVFFFSSYISDDVQSNVSYYEEFVEEVNVISKEMPMVPFSSIWLAGRVASSIPADSMIHLGIGNVMRAFNLYELRDAYNITANTGAWGIDGALSTGLGMALVRKDKLQFIFCGDLAFFYDMNALGNRHISKNIRVLIVNNGKGVEMRIHESGVQKNLGEDADFFSAAGGHYGKQSRELVKHYATDLGFLYLQANSKEEFDKQLPIFLREEIGDAPIVLEVFTSDADEREALTRVCNIRKDKKKALKKFIIDELGEEGAEKVRKCKQRLEHIIKK